jgi:hypothetical protein
MKAYFGTIYELENDIASWRRDLPASIACSPGHMALHPQDTIPKVLLINIAYHQCQCALHSSLVPLYSCGPHQLGWIAIRTASAQVAFEHANSISALLNEALESCWDISRIPPFVGFAAYCASSVQLAFTWCSDPKVAAEARINISNNLSVIRQLGKYWKLIAALVRPNSRLIIRQVRRLT